MSRLLKSIILVLSLALLSPIAATGIASAEETIVSNQRFSVVKNNQGSYTWRTKDGEGGTEATSKSAKKAARKALKAAKKSDGVVADENCDRQEGVNC